MNDKTKHVFTVALVVLIAGILDFAFSTLVQDVFHAPLFFDMTFAMAVLFAYGVFPAIMTYVVNVICGCLKLVILYGKNDYIYLFTLSALTIILITWLFVRKKENLKKGVNFVFIYILLAAVCAALACSVVSGIISYFTFSLVLEAGPFDKFIFAFSGDQMGVLASCIVGRIPITILDRIITTFAGFGLYLLFTRLMYRGGVVIRHCKRSATIQYYEKKHKFNYIFLFPLSNIMLKISQRKIYRFKNPIQCLGRIS